MSVAVVKVIATRLDTVEEEQITWYWRGRLARSKVTVMDGDPGMGKSTIGLDLIARFTRGDEMPCDGTRVPETLVGLLSDEDGLADTIVPRLAIAGAKRANIYHLVGESAYGGKCSLTIPDHMEQITEIIKRRGIGYLHIDPVAAHASPHVNMYIDQEVRTKIMGPLANLAADTGITIVIVRHPTKQVGGSALYRGGGSIGIIGAARFGLFFGRDPNDETRRVIASTKANIGPLPPSLVYRLIGVPGSDHAEVRWDDVPSHLTADELSAAPPSPTVKATTVTQQWLLAFLMAAPREANETYAAAEAAGHSKRTLERAKADLGVESKRVGFGPGGASFWCLPGQSPVGETAAEPSAAFDWGYVNGHDSAAAFDRWTG